ncbi:MAG: UpxY family transcription antiterminator [Bacteroidaceae bacterium]
METDEKDKTDSLYEPNGSLLNKETSSPTLKSSPSVATKDTSVSWLAIQTLYCKELDLEKYLKEKGLTPFVPMRYQDIETKEGKHKRILVPAIHNLLFVEKTVSDKQFLTLLSDCFLPLIIYKNKETRKFYEIPGSQMVEIRAICDPSYKGTLFVPNSIAEARIGSEVRVIRGNFKGLTGKLTRYKKRSYVVIQVATMGVLIHIPKWYCEKV